MDKELFIQEFEKNLKKIHAEKTNKEWQKYRGSRNWLHECVNALKMVIHFSVHSEMNYKIYELVKASFFKVIDDLAKRKDIEGKAAYYSKTTFERMVTNFKDAPKTVASSSSAPLKKPAKPEVADKASSRGVLTAVYKETKEIAAACGKGLDKKLQMEMIKGTKAYHTRMNGDLLSLLDKVEIPKPSAKPPVAAYATKFDVVDCDSFQMAKRFSELGLKPLVLNMANKISVGGGVENGATAQEEDLFRCSDYHLALYPHGNPSRLDLRYRYHFPIQEFGCYYTPNVQVFRDRTKDYAFIKPFSVSCIAIAGYDLGKPDILEDTVKSPKVGIDLGKFKEFTKLKIRHLLEVAILHGHDSLVLGALSCGAFRLQGDNDGKTANLVAEAYYEVLLEPAFRNRFKNIGFAVLASGPTGTINYKIFNTMAINLTKSYEQLPLKEGDKQATSPAKPLQFSQLPPAASTATERKERKERTEPVGADPRVRPDPTVGADPRVRPKDDTEAKLNELLKIYDEQIRFFDNLPKGLERSKVETALKTCIFPAILKGDQDYCYPAFGDMMGKHQDMMLERLLDSFETYDELQLVQRSGLSV